MGRRSNRSRRSGWKQTQKHGPAPSQTGGSDTQEPSTTRDRNRLGRLLRSSGIIGIILGLVGLAVAVYLNHTSGRDRQLKHDESIAASQALSGELRRNTEMTEELLRRLDQLLPGDAEIDSIRGMASSDKQEMKEVVTLLRGRETDRAEEILDRILQNYRNVADVVFLRGSISLQRGDLEKARKDFEAAISLDPGLSRAWNALAITFWQGGEYQEAIARIDSALRLGREIERRPTLRANRAVLISEMGRPREAAESLRVLVEVGEDSLRAGVWYNLGICNKRSEDYRSALACFDSAASYDSSRFGLWSNRGLVLALLGRQAESRESYETSLRKTRGDHVAWLRLGEIAAQDGAYLAAIALLDSALHRKETLADAWSIRGACLSRLGRNHEALASVERAVEVAPDNPVFWYNKALIQASFGDWIGAKESFSNVSRTTRGKD